MKFFIRLLDQSGLMVFILMMSDLLGMGLAFLLSYMVRNDFIGPQIQPFREYLHAFPAVALILILTFHTFGLYTRRQRITPLSEWVGLFRAITLVWVLVMAASFLYKYDYSRILVVLLYGFALIFIVVGRTLVRSVYGFLQKRGIGVTNVLIIGTGKPAKKVAEGLKAYDAFGYRVVGFVAEEKLHQIVSLIEKNKIHEVYVADPRLSHERILELIHRADKTDVKFKVVSDLFEIVAGDIDLDELEGLPSLHLKSGEPNLLYRFIKRLFDLLFSMGALVIFAPIWFLLMAIIRLESPGSPIFKQERVGKNGKPFLCYKFRTMYATAHPNEYAPKHKSDARVTQVGRWLRKTSLDEVPQFWNVLKGDMSVVGPRPEMTFIVKGYREWQRRRLDVKPGITGLWQILGRKDLPLHENIEYDFYYIKNQSLLLDLVILLKTIEVVLRGKGAY